MTEGYVGQVLRVDLTKGECDVEELDIDLARDFIGGRGLGAKILLDEVDPKVEPLSPGNKLIFATGPLTGTGAPAGCRYMAVSRSPLTGAIGYANSGGYFAPELKFAGYDVIIFEGKSPEPVYLSIKNDEVELKPARHLWGKTTRETEDLIKAELNDEWIARETHIASIGPAGEKLVRFAAIINDGGSAAGRTGLGAVMGSKNLKAVAVRGTKGVKVADGAAFRQAVATALEKIKASPVSGPQGSLARWGTAVGTYTFNKIGTLPTRNFTSGVFEGAKEIDGRTLASTILIRNKGCFACPIGCKRVSKAIDPKFQGHGEGPEYETVSLLGPCCGVSNPSAIAKAGFICNEMGLDTISAGNTIACAMELYERGFLSEAEAGYKLNFGNAEAMVELTRKIGLREGFGDILAEGAYRVAQKYGHPELFVGAKKLESAAHHARGLQGMGLAYATCNRGACHNNAMTSNLEVFGVPYKLDPAATEGKAQLVKTNQDILALTDSTGLCYFVLWGMWMDELLALLNTATGLDYTMESMMLSGERIWNAERLFNLRAGFTKADDHPSVRMTNEPMPDGPAKGQVVKLDAMLPEYYQLRGWDEKGVPTRKKLAELGLK